MAEPAPKTGRPPLTILAAMGIAIGGAAVSSAFDLWLGVQTPGYLGPLALLYLIPTVIRVALNVWFLVGMWHRAEWAWSATVTLVGLGAVFDLCSFALPFIADPDIQLSLIGRILVQQADGVDARTIGALVHLVVIQAPILALLWLKPSRLWVGTDKRVDSVHDPMPRS